MSLWPVSPVLSCRAPVVLVVTSRLQRYRCEFGVAAMQFYVYVKYLFDNVRKVTVSRNVSEFRPKNVDDFEPGRTYSVYWEGDDTTKGGYYDAELLHMTDSKEEMDEHIAARRQRSGKKGKSQQNLEKNEVMRVFCNFF